MSTETSSISLLSIKQRLVYQIHVYVYILKAECDQNTLHVYVYILKAECDKNT